MTILAEMTRRLRPRRDEPRPALSIVVPVYGVEEYLAECLDSILAQPFTDFEVVVVDDGSVDGSAAIAQRYAEAEPRIRVVRQENAGLGAARNRGVEEARGHYLTFVDSDDRLPHDAYTIMMRTIEASGSDLVCGTLKRDEGERTYALQRMRDNHRIRRVGVTLDEMPGMLADVFAVNKIFRRSFWDRAGLAFPVGIRYEDQPTLTRAFLAADRFDVVRHTVYLWRIREDESSITQRRHDLDDLADRIVTKRTSTEAVYEQAPHLRDRWLCDILPVDMGEYFRSAATGSEEYWKLVRACVEEFWSDDTVPFDRTWIPVQQRLLGWLVAHDRREDLQRLVDFLAEHRGDPPLELRGDHVVALLPGVDDPAAGLPDTVRVLAPHELRWEGRVLAASYDEEPGGLSLTLAGFAVVANVATRGRDTELTGTLRGPGDSSGLLTLEPAVEPRASRFLGRTDERYDDCGFTASVDVTALVRRCPPPDEGVSVWRLDLERRTEQVRVSGGITSFDPVDVDREWRPVDDHVAVRVAEAAGGLVLEVRHR